MTTTTTTPIPFGVIGTGWITSSFIECAEATGQWKLAAVYSRTEATGRAFGAKHGLPDNIHTSLAALGADPAITTVYIASPNSLHFPQAQAMLEAGKHVILEKPSCSTLAEWDALLSLARAKHLHLLEANRHLQEANFKVARDALARLGPIYGASLTYASYSSRYDRVLAGELPPIFSLTYSAGALVDLGVYPLAFAVALFGAPTSARYLPFLLRNVPALAADRPDAASAAADGGGFLLLAYPTFAVQINASKCYTSTAPTEIYGERGTLVLDGVADIASVVFVDARTKERTELATAPRDPLNLKAEAAEFARVFAEADWEEERRLQGMSREVLRLTEGLRRENGLVFEVERKGQ